MATAKKNTELAPVENFALTTAYDGLDPELAAELKDQMDDLDDESGINCRTIKIPSGGNLAFTVQGDEDGDEDYLKDIEGVIVFTHRMNGYWPNAFGSSITSGTASRTSRKNDSPADSTGLPIACMKMNAALLTVASGSMHR